MEFGLIGEKLSHSFSKEIHNLIGDYKYELKELTAMQLDKFMTDKDFLGINVTIPYKQAVIKYLDHVESNALEIGAVNTVINKNGKLYGYNTDFYGLKKMIENSGLPIEGKTVAILGTGGTSNTANAVVKSLGAKQIVKVTRNNKQDCIDYNQLQNLANDIQIIINTTPCEMYPNVENNVINLEKFGNLQGVFDVVYNPLKTNLVQSSCNKNIVACGGLYMLVAQAVKAYALFMEKDFSDNLLEDVYKKIYLNKLNVVLTGMPSCGKSTVGKIVADKLGKEFIDTDLMIEQYEGESIPQIFADDGEQYFRKIETEIIKKVSLLNGKVIATGGGVVLNTDNVKALKRNGKVFFIDRPLSLLTPTADRPLSVDKNAMEKRYSERYGIYNSTCDVKVVADILPDQVAEKILGELI